MNCFNFIFLLFLFILAALNRGIGLEWRSLSPSAREFATIIVDSINRRLVLFGGGDYRFSGRWRNDVWEMWLNSPGSYIWMPVNTSGTPPAGRAGHIAVYNPRLEKMVVFAGDTGWGNRTNDIWTLDLNTHQWERINPPDPLPPPRSAFAGIFHPRRNSLIIFGGDGLSGHLNDVWEFNFDSLKWREIPVSGNRPSPRGGGFSGFYDKAHNRMIIFGGFGDGNFYNDLWSLDLTPGNERWTQLSPSGNLPPPRSVYASGYSPTTNMFYIYGGWSDYGELDDLWVLNLSNLTWTQLYPTNEGPGPKRKISGVYDFFGNNFLVFGGNYYPDYYFAETYLLHIESEGVKEWKKVSHIPGPFLFLSSPSLHTCRIKFLVPHLQKVEVKIISPTGRIVKTLYSGIPQDFISSLLWDGTDENGKKVSAGTYICELRTEEEVLSKKLVLMR
ncbi:MAG: kelch repeat-containing protein [candidate division WOR-3 bacterium]